MLRLLIALAVLLSVAQQAVQSTESGEDFVAREMNASAIPGLSYAVVEEGTITSSGVSGLANARDETAVRPETPFGIGSISKSFTALAVMQLVEAGAVELDAPVSTYLDRFRGQEAGATTIRQLLGHRSGFSTLQGNTAYIEGSGSDVLERHVNALALVAPAYTPGDGWDYSNSNYQILGRVIEVASEQTFRDYIAANILEPLGMDDSFVADGEIHESIAAGHTPWFGGKRTLAPGPTDLLTAPQGGILATSHDLGLYMIMMMNGEDDVLSAEGKELMLRPAATASPWYGFGWYLNSGDGSAWHGGTSPGVETLLVMVPGEQRGAVALANAGSGLGFGETGALLNGLTSQAVGLEYSSGPSWPRKTLFVSLALLPIIYVLSMAWAWRYRSSIRAKPGAGGLFSWWFPLLATTASAWVLLWLVPRLFGAPLGTIRVFSPDFHLTLVASAVTGILWALFRLGVVYSDRFRSASSPQREL